MSCQSIAVLEKLHHKYLLRPKQRGGGWKLVKKKSLAVGKEIKKSQHGERIGEKWSFMGKGSE